MQIATIKRNAGYVFWAVAEQGFGIGVTRLLLFPVAAYLIGKETFGLFVTALSVAAMLGATPAIGLGTGVIRHLAGYPEEKRGQFCYTAMYMCHIAMCILIGLGVLCVAGVAVARPTPAKLAACLIPLLLSLYAENQLFLMLMELRVARCFRDVTLWCAFQAACASVLGIAGTLIGGAVGLSWGYALGNWTAYWMLRSRRRAWLRESYDRGMARVLKAIWLHITIASILTLSAQYLNRIILSFWYPFAEVSDLYGATTLMYLFLAPMSSGSNLLLGMLARHSSVASLSRGAKMQALLLAAGGVIGLPVLLKVAGPVLLHILFPGFGHSATRLLDILVWGMPFGVLVFLVRPFVIKFAPIQVNPVINSIALVGQLVPALALIPSLGSRGAAWAVVVGNAAYALALIAVIVLVSLYPRRVSSTSAAECENPVQPY